MLLMVQMPAEVASASNGWNCEVLRLCDGGCERLTCVSESTLTLTDRRCSFDIGGSTADVGAGLGDK